MDNSYDVKNLYKEEDYNTFKNHYDKVFNYTIILVKYDGKTL